MNILNDSKLLHAKMSICIKVSLCAKVTLCFSDTYPNLEFSR